MKISTKDAEVLLYVSLQTQGSVCGKWAAMVTFKYLGALFTCDGSRSARRLIHGLVKLTKFCVSVIALWPQNGSFQTPQTCQFSNRFFCFDRYLWSWIFGNDRKNITQVQIPKMGFLRRVHGVTKGRTEVRLRKKQVWRLHIWT